MGTDEGKSRWVAILDSSGVTALITTLVGGLIVGCITSRYQDKERQRDRARAETAEYLERERKVVEDAFSVTGRLIAASEDMIQVTSPAFDERRRSSPDVSTIREKKKEIITRYNDADSNWHAQRTILTLRLRMEHGNDQAFTDAWKEMSSAVTDFSDCSRIWFEQHSDPVDSDKLKEACATRKRSIEDSINSLTTEILRSRRASSPAQNP